MAETSLNAERMEQIINVFGSLDENIRIIEQEFGVSIVNRDTELKISGEDEAVSNAAKTLEWLHFSWHPKEKPSESRMLDM